MLSLSQFSQKQLYKKNTVEMQDMLYTKDINWNNLESKWKNGTSIVKSVYDYWITQYEIFSKNRDYIEQFLGDK